MIRKQFESDTMLIPKETAWFGYYEDEGFDTLLSAQQVNFSKLFHGSFGLWKSKYVYIVQQTKLYREDWIGLKALDAAGKVKFESVLGDHLSISDEEVVEFVVPYLMQNCM